MKRYLTSRRNLTATLILALSAELDIHFSSYQLENVAGPVPQLRGFEAAPAVLSMGTLSQHW